MVTNKMATLMDIGLLYYFLPLITFLFVFALVYAVLDKTKILGENVSLNFVAALTIALLTLFVGRITNLIQFIVPWFVFLFVFFGLMFVGLMFLGIKEETIWSNLSIWTVIIIGFFLLLLGIVQVYGDVLSPYVSTNATKTIASETMRTLFHPRVLAALFILLVAALTIRFLVPRVEEK